RLAPSRDRAEARRHDRRLAPRPAGQAAARRAAGPFPAGLTACHAAGAFIYSAKSLRIITVWRLPIMARVTVEDCVLQVPNRFDLVTLAAQRARDISAGAPLTLERDNDKNPVVALREIADTTIELDNLSNSLVQGLQRQVEVDEPEEEGGFGAGGGDLLSELLEAEAGQQALEDASIDGEFEDEPEADFEEGAEGANDKEA